MALGRTALWITEDGYSTLVGIYDTYAQAVNAAMARTYRGNQYPIYVHA